VTLDTGVKKHQGAIGADRRLASIGTQVSTIRADHAHPNTNATHVEMFQVNKTLNQIDIPIKSPNSPSL